jgi:peptidase E
MAMQLAIDVIHREEFSHGKVAIGCRAGAVVFSLDTVVSGDLPRICG